VDVPAQPGHLCTTAALYWCTGAIGSSLRLYYEHFGKPWPLAHQRTPRLEAPCAFAVFPKDVVHLPRGLLEQHTNLVRYTVMPRGGHFGAAEQPALLVEDLRAFFR
jgi:pimeloyl-ACP methyl ester carboxylesterase